MDIDIDKIIYLAKEANLPDDERLKAIQKMVPDLLRTKSTYNDKFINEMFLDLYQHNRGLGLPLKEVAYVCGITFTLLNNMLQGVDISYENYITLCEAELIAETMGKATRLKGLETVAKNGDVETKKYLLEKLNPKEYGPKSTVDVNLGDGKVILEVVNYHKEKDESAS